MDSVTSLKSSPEACSKCPPGIILYRCYEKSRCIRNCICQDPHFPSFGNWNGNWRWHKDLKNYVFTKSSCVETNEESVDEHEWALAKIQAETSLNVEGHNMTVVKISIYINGQNYSKGMGYKGLGNCALDNALRKLRLERFRKTSRGCEGQVLRSRSYETVDDAVPNAASTRPNRKPKRIRTMKGIAFGFGVCVVFSAVPIVAAEYPLQGVAHAAAGTSITASISLLPLRNGGDLVQPEYWITAAYGIWALSFVTLLVCELVRRPEQRKLLVGSVLFASLSLLGTLTQSAPSTLEGVLCWGPTALTVSLFVIAVVMNSVDRRGFARGVAALVSVPLHLQESGVQEPSRVWYGRGPRSGDEDIL